MSYPLYKRRYYAPEYDWLDQLQVGDIIVSNNGDQRLVRVAKYWPADAKYGRANRLHYIVLAIRHCSWTHRGDTWIERTTVAQRFKPTGLKADVLVDPNTITCCEAKMLL